MIRRACDIKDLQRVQARLRGVHANKKKSKLSLEKTSAGILGLGGQYPDSSTNFFAVPGILLAANA